MKISHEGERVRFYEERKKVEATAGFPLRDGVSDEARERVMRFVIRRTNYSDKHGLRKDFTGALIADLQEHFGNASSTRGWSEHYFIHDVNQLEIDGFFQVLEMAVARIVQYRASAAADINAINSLLADDRSSHRLVNVGSEGRPLIHVQKIDNEHLHTVLTDRTFELTRVAEFASAQGDYADAWKHYSTGNLDNALTDAHKAVESACKVAVKKADPNSTPDNLSLGPLVAELVRLQVIPTQLTHVAGQLEQIFRNAGTLRNQPGAAHGSLNPTTPEASVALLGLRMSGTLISFLAERWLQMKP